MADSFDELWGGTAKVDSQREPKPSEDAFDELWDTKPSEIKLSPYEKARLSNMEPVAGPLGPANPQEVTGLVSALTSPLVDLPTSRKKGGLPAMYNAVVKPLVESLETPGMLLAGPLLTESVPARIGAGLLFGSMAGKSGLEKMQSQDQQTQMEGRLELASVPLLALGGGAERARIRPPEGFVEPSKPVSEIVPKSQEPAVKSTASEAPPAALTEGETPAAPAVSEAKGEPAATGSPEPAIAETTVTPGVTQEVGPGMGAALASGEIPETGAGAEKYGIAERIREERAKAGQVDPVEPGVGINTPDSIERGREIIRTDQEAPEKLMTAFEQDPQRGISAEGMAVARAHGEALAAGARTIEDNFGTDSPQYKQAKEALSSWDKRSKAMQTEWHKAGMAQQGETDIDTGSFTGLERAHREATGKDFTPQQKPKAQKIAKQVNAASQSVQIAKAQLNKALNDDFGNLTERSNAEQRAFDAANKTVREAAARAADAENKARVAEEVRRRAEEKVQEDAKARAQRAVDKTKTSAAIRAAEAENKARVDQAVRDKQAADIQVRAAKRAQEAAWKVVREAAARAAKAERELMADPGRQIWEKAKAYLDQGIDDFDTIRNKVATDLGMKVDRVTRELAYSKRAKYAADDLWRKQQQARRLHEQAKSWLTSLEVPGYQKALAGIPKILFGLKVGFHGTVALGTHAPTVAFQPRFWKTYVTDFGKMYRMVGSSAYYERQVQDLLRRPNYITARRAGLVNDPFVFEDYNSPDTVKYFVKLSGMGNRGYSVLKILRQDMFDQMWEGLPKTAKIPEVAQAISDGLNHATGVVKGKAPKGANIGLFAPRLEASRVMWLAGDPIKAATTFLDWKNAGPGEKAFAMNQAKEKAWVAGTLVSMLALNQGFLAATDSKQRINFDNPFRSDWMKFKAAGMDFAYGNAMISMARLPVRLWVGIKNEGKLNKIILEDENTAKTLFDYARSQASPFAGLTLDLAFGRDFQERPLPRAGFGFLPGRTTIPKRLKAQGVTMPYSWTEFWSEQLTPIPFQEGLKEVWHGMGMNQEQAKSMNKAVATIAIMSATGGRLTDDWDLKKNEPIKITGF